jgi:hypothetical protein
MRRLEALEEEISDLKNVIGSLMGSNRNFAASAESGKGRVSFIRVDHIETA